VSPTIGNRQTKARTHEFPARDKKHLVVVFLRLAFLYLGVSPPAHLRVLRRARQEKDLRERAHLHEVELPGNVGEDAPSE
jgi:type II secretory pathway component PulM